VSNRDLRRQADICPRPLAKKSMPNITLLLYVYAAVILLNLPVQAQAINQTQTEAISALVTRDVPDGAPGVAFGIVQDGEIVYTQYAGLANLEARTAIDAKSRFNIASNAKQFTALAILDLIEKRKLQFTTDIRTFFPGLLPQIKDPITIQHLLNHTSGLRDFYDLLSLQNITWWKKTMNNQEVITLLEQQQALNFPPGTQYLYSNSNYVLLAEIISRVTGKSFAAHMDMLFKALGMPDTSFEPDYSRIAEPVARPYFNFNTWTGYAWIWNVTGDGNLFTTLPDQLQWERIIQGKPTRAVSRRVIRQSQQLEQTTFRYGYGLEFETYRSLPVAFHHGGTGAWKATLLRFPGKQLSLVTFSNSGKTDVIDQNQKTADILLKAPNTTPAFVTQPPPDSTSIAEEELIGIYQNASGFTFRFVRKTDGIYLVRNGRNDVRLERESGSVYRQIFDPAFKQAFKRNGDGTLTVTAYYTTHAPYTLTKVEADFSQFDPQQLNGEYVNTETAVTMVIAHTTGDTFSVTIAGDDNKGFMITPWKMMVNQYQIIWNDDKTECYLQGDRIRQVRFKKIGQ
jgi:CubicO group peptidase (beta-lactamase class C family)